jgi:hypothetical protein
VEPLFLLNTPLRTTKNSAVSKKQHHLQAEVEVSEHRAAPLAESPQAWERIFFAGELDVHIILGQILPLVDQNSSSRQIKSERKIDIKSCQDKFFVESPLVFHYLNLFILFFFMGCNETW